MKASNVLGSMASLAVASGLMLVAGPAQAVAYGEPDCTATTCGNPNVVMLVGIRSFFGTPYATITHCSGSLIGRYQGADQQAYYLFLSAGHCTYAWRSLLGNGVIDSVGVSFDPAPPKQPDFFAYRFDPDGFAQGGEPVTQANYGPINGWNLLIDYGAVSVPAATVEAKWPQAAQLAPVLLASDLSLRLETVIAATALPQLQLSFHSVGYGISEFLDVGSNAGGLNQPGADLGTRRLASNLLFQNLRPTLLQTGGNPVRDQDSLCSGDSGGPVFLGSGATKVQVGITSSGDRFCHSNNFFARIDIALARDFIACIRTHADNLLACGY